MALTETERWVGGIVWDGDTPAQTTTTTDAHWFNGFLRDADGRLVTAPAGTPAVMFDAFLRTSDGAVVTTETTTGQQRRLGGLMRAPAGELVLAAPAA